MHGQATAASWERARIERPGIELESTSASMGPRPRRVALVHDWLTDMRGGEKCLEVFCELFPHADVYTLLHRRGAVSATVERHRIASSFIQHIPLAPRIYRYCLPLFPFAIESFDLTGYDLVLSSSHCVAKGVRVPADTCHIAYTHTPMRYVWDQYDSYFATGRASWAVRLAMRSLRRWLQSWDVESSRGVDLFVANSQHVAGRIRRHYGREAVVIHPPVDVKSIQVTGEDRGYYLIVSALVPYKRLDLAIEAFNRLGRPLEIIGTGPEERRLRDMAGPNVRLRGWRSDAEVRLAYESCRAVVFPGEEDFGIVPVEAMAAGKPVIAYGRGGATETVIPASSANGATGSAEGAPTGVFFFEQTAESLTRAISTLEACRGRFDPRAIRRHAEMFSRDRFKRQIRDFVRGAYASWRAQPVSSGESSSRIQRINS